VKNKKASRPKAGRKKSATPAPQNAPLELKLDEMVIEVVFDDTEPPPPAPEPRRDAQRRVADDPDQLALFTS
jgi:hypothetical protein